MKITEKLIVNNIDVIEGQFRGSKQAKRLQLTS
jgi:hypothetical protein